MKAYGLTPDDLPQVKRDKTSWAYFIEPHIEQGPVLESEKLSVGIVDTIVGIRTKKLIITGRPDHGGTIPMHLRLDAVVAAMKIVHLVDEMARELNDGTVTTCGSLHVEPGRTQCDPR